MAPRESQSVEHGILPEPFSSQTKVVMPMGAIRVTSLIVRVNVIVIPLRKVMENCDQSRKIV